MATSSAGLLLRIEGLEQRHKIELERLQENHRHQIQQLEDTHASEVACLIGRMDQDRTQTESLSKVVTELAYVVNKQTTGIVEDVRTTTCATDQLASRVKELQSQLTVNNMANSHVVETGIPKHNQAFEDQIAENKVLRKEIADVRQELVTSNRDNLEANDDLANQIQVLSERAKAVERNARQQADELEDFLDAHRVMLDDLVAEVKDMKTRTEDCEAESKAMFDIVIRANKKIKQLKDARDGQADELKALNDQVKNMASTLTAQANKTPSPAAASITNVPTLPEKPKIAPHPTVSPSLGHYPPSNYYGGFVPGRHVPRPIPHHNSWFPVHLQ